MKKVVFLGPSLPLAEAQALCPDAVFLPPARCGDLLEVLKLVPTHILLIDGFFEAMPAVWHKELLFVMTKQVAVMGASSMGALRASELSAYGLQGIGTIAKWYQEGVIHRDDEVAVLHLNAEHHYRAVTEPLVNIRSTLAVDDPVFQSLQALPYRERIWPSNTPVVNQKALDAREALLAFNNMPESPHTFSMPYSLYFKGLHQQVFCRAPTLPAQALSPSQQQLTQARWFAPCYRELVKLAKLLYACTALNATIDPQATLAHRPFHPHLRWPSLNHPEWLAKIIAAQVPYKAFLERYFQAQQFMPSMTELKRKLTAWQKDEKLETSESVLAWLKTHHYSQTEFEQTLVFETLFDYLIDRGNVFLSIDQQELSCHDYFAQAFDLGDSAAYVQKISDREDRRTFLEDHQEDVGLLNALDFYRSEDLCTWLTSCG